MSSLPFVELGVMGRNLIQLKRLTIFYSTSQNASYGIRKFLDENLLDFAKKVPSVSIYLRKNAGQARVEADYLCGRKISVVLAQLDEEKIKIEFWRLRSHSGINVGQIKRYWHTTRPSIQGNWHPFLFPFPDNSEYCLRDQKTNKDSECRGSEDIEETSLD